MCSPSAYEEKILRKGPLSSRPMGKFVEYGLKPLGPVVEKKAILKLLALGMIQDERTKAQRRCFYHGHASK